MNCGDPNDKEPFFSVLIPVYNVELFIDECVKSALSQSMKDFEIVLVNDGSTDASVKHCRALQRLDPDTIQLIEQENRGLYEARKRGIQAARGTYLVFLDGDDLLRIDALERMYESLASDTVDIMLYRCCKNRNFSYDAYSAFFAPALGSVGEITIHDARKILLTEDRINNIAFKTVRRTCLGDLSAEEDRRRLTMSEDKLISARALDCAKTCAFFDEVLYYYRPNPAGITKNGFKKSRFEDICSVHEELGHYLRRWNMESEAGEFHARFLIQASFEIADLFNSSLSRHEKRIEADIIRSNAVFQSSYEAVEGYGLKLHRRLIIELLRHRRFGLLELWSRLYRISMRLTERVRGR